MTVGLVLLIGLFVPSLPVQALYEIEASQQQGNQSPGAPGTPSDGGSVTNSTSVTWSWTAATDSDGSISDYQVDVGTSAGASDVVSAASTSGSLSYTRTGLSNGSTYYARVRAVDNEGATGSYSSNSDGIAIDTSAPTFSSLSAGSLSTSGATITWTTNEGATGQVQYGTSSGSYSSNSSTVSSYDTSHSIALSSLSAGTTYYLRVIGTDQAGNQGTSSETSFTTSSASSSSSSSSSDSSSSSSSSTSSTPSSTSSSSSTSSDTASSTSSADSGTASSSSGSTTTTKKAEAIAGALNVYVDLRPTSSQDVITETKAVTTLPSSAFILALDPAKTVKTAKGTWQGQTVEFKKDATTKRYQAQLTSQADVGDAELKATVTYDDGKKEELTVKVSVSKLGRVLDPSGNPVADATVTLQAKKDGDWTTWDPGTSGQSPTATTEADGTFGFVVPAGDYRLTATHTSYQDAKPVELSVAAPGGPAVADLTLLVAGATTEQPKGGWPWWVWLLIVLILLGLLFFWWKRRRDQQSRTGKPLFTA